MTIYPKDMRKLYEQVYIEVMKKDKILTIDLDMIITKKARMLEIKMDHKRKQYLRGFFKKNKVLIPERNYLKVNKGGK